MKLSKSLLRARQIINEQDAPLSVRRSAFVLYCHELERMDPATGKLFTPRKALANVMKWIAQQKARRKMKRLRPMERQIVQLLATGKTQKQIAVLLKRTRGTIIVRSAEMRKRLGVVSMYQVVAVAVERGWIDAPKLDD